MYDDSFTINNAMKYAINLLGIKFIENNKRIGKYLICDICGVGSNGIVYTVENIETNRKFALKLLNLSYYIINTFKLDNINYHKSVYLNIERIKKEFDRTHYQFKDFNREILCKFQSLPEEKSFRREFNSLKAIPKNNLCVFLEDYGVLRVDSIFEKNKTSIEIPYIVMPIFSGITLTNYIEKTDYFIKDYNKIFKILKNIIQIIKIIHDSNIIHRDLYSNNFLYNEITEEIFLLDFDASLYNNDLSLDTIGERRGARRFMSPEQFKNPQSVDFRSDYFFIGSLLFYMLTKETPFSRERDANTLPRDIQNFLNPSDFPNIELYRKIVLFVNKLLAYNVKNRFQSIVEIEKNIDEILALT